VTLTVRMHMQSPVSKSNTLGVLLIFLLYFLYSREGYDKKENCLIFLHHILYCGGGLAQLVATLVDQRSYSTPGQVSTGMGDRIGVQLPLREIYLSLTNHPGQLSLAIPLWVGAMSTGQRAVMLCDWEVKVDMVLFAGNTV